jgi:hypothetical protein
VRLAPYVGVSGILEKVGLRAAPEDGARAKRVPLTIWPDSRAAPGSGQGGPVWYNPLPVEPDIPKRLFSYDEAAALMPEVRRLTEDAYRRVAALSPLRGRRARNARKRDEADEIVRTWAETLARMGLEIKGLWLVDFDNGAGYYCWQYPEEGLHYFHSYEDGFGGRLRIH